MKKRFFNIFVYVSAVLIFILFKVPVQASGNIHDLHNYYEPVFDEGFYEQHPGMTDFVVKNFHKIENYTYEILLPHFIDKGMAQGLRGSHEFDVHTYMKNYPDLAAAFGDNFSLYYYHYLNGGKAEGRKGDTALFPTSIINVTEAGTQVTGLFNPSNSKAVSPMAAKPVESLATYPNYWTWTASNGYTLKLKVDPNTTSVKLPEQIIYDQPISFRPEPDNAFLWAYLEYTDDLFGGEMGKPEKAFASSAGLPLVELRGEKGDLNELSPSWDVFQKQYNAIWRPLVVLPEHVDLLSEEANSFSLLRFDFPSFVSGKSDTKSKSVYVGMSGSKYVGASGASKFSLYHTGTYSCYSFPYRFEETIGKGWILEIKYHKTAPPYELMWYAIRNSLRLVDSDAELIYQQIYEHFYGGNHIFPDYNIAVTLGNSNVIALTPNYYNVNRLTGHEDDNVTTVFYFFN